MKKMFLVFGLFVTMLFCSVSSNAMFFDTWSNYYAPWTNSAFQEGETYCGWWSALIIVNTSDQTQVVDIEIISKNTKYEGSLTLIGYGVYNAHSYTLINDLGLNINDIHNDTNHIIIRVKQYTDIVSNLIFHNGNHSYNGLLK